MNKKKSICIEFVGIWGSGKTTLKNSIYDSLINKNLFVKRDLDFYSLNKFYRRFYAFILIIFSPLHQLKTLFIFIKIFFILKPLDKEEIDIFKTLIKVFIMKNYFLRMKSPDVLLEEGISHLLPIFKNMSKINKNDLLFLISPENNKSNTIYVFIDVSLETAYKRVLEDNSNNFKRFSIEDTDNLKDRYLHMIKNQKIIKDILQNKIIIQLNGKNSIIRNSNYLLERIKFIYQK